ncbi:hypothetical protein [Clostridium sp.]|uniref:hypothetical protein n=1 Tax=Clostridium sp. TaxID=1506 RepID=UPI003216F995
MTKWEEIKKTHKGVELARIIAEGYVELGNYKCVEEKYEISRKRLSSQVSKYKDELQEKYPELMQKFHEVTKSNNGINQYTKGEKSKLTEKEKKWEHIKNTYEGMELSKYLMEQYILVGNAMALEGIYGVKKAHILLTIRKYSKELAEAEPHLTKMFEDKVEYNRIYGNRIAAEKNSGERGLTTFKPEFLDKLPRKIECRKFIDYVLEFNTGFSTGERLVKLANQRGIQVYDIIKGKEKIIKF